MKTSLNVSISQPEVTTAQYGTVIIGAEPYGLATATHLLAHALNMAMFVVPFSYSEARGPIAQSF